MQRFLKQNWKQNNLVQLDRLIISSLLSICFLLGAVHLQAQNNDLFDRYTWLSAIADPSDCTTEKVEEYQTSIYKYLWITSADGKETLYNSEGTFYCKNSATYDCIAAYNLAATADSWGCGEEGQQESNCSNQDPFSLPAIQEAINTPPRTNADGSICWYIENIIQFQFEGATFYRVVEDANPSQSCVVDWGTRFYSCDGELIGGTGIYPECDDAALCVYDIPTLSGISNASGTVIWDSGIGPDRNEEIFEAFSWLRELVNTNNCSTEKVELYLGNAQHPYNYILVTDANGSAKLYNTTGQIYCEQTPTNICIDAYVAAYGISSLPYNTWTCRNQSVEGCRANVGNILFRTCADGSLYYLIGLEDGRLLDPYLDPTVTYEPIEGQNVYFDYEPASFDSPCSIAEQAINITCIEPTENNPTPDGNCINYSGTVVLESCDDGTNFFYIDTDDGRRLDPYLAAGIDYTFTAGQRVNFDFEQALFSTPCSSAERAVIITCIKAFDFASSPCTITLTSRSCRRIGIYDENDILLQIIDPGFVPSPGPPPLETWEDTRPLVIGITRTYIFKEGNFELGRTTASCENTMINIQTRYPSGCSDAAGVAVLNNVGCRDLLIFGTSGNLGWTVPSGESVSLGPTSKPIYILMAGSDTLGVTSVNGVSERDIDTGGCGNNNNVIFADYPWLSTLVDPNNCSNEKIEVWKSDIYTYLMVTDKNGDAKLYNHDGLFYCQNNIDYDCIVGYRLEGPISSWNCGDLMDNENPSDQCTITIRNNECRTIGVYDEADNLLTTMLGAAVFAGPISLWEDTRPLATNTTRTYIFKLNNLILGRQTVSCERPNIGVVNNYFSGCTDVAGTPRLTNTGCRTIQVFSSSGNVINTVAPNETFFLLTIDINFLIAGNDTLGISSNAGNFEVNSGGCSSNSNPQLFEDYPWLNDLVNPTTCSNEKVEVWKSGIYTYLMVTGENGDPKLYNQDGLFYCQNNNDYNCIIGYRLEGPISSWSCGAAPEQEEDCTQAPLSLSNIQSAINREPSLNDQGQVCNYVSRVLQIQYEGLTYYTVVDRMPSGAQCPTDAARDLSYTFYDCEGNFVLGTIDLCRGEALCDPLFAAARSSSAIVLWQTDFVPDDPSSTCNTTITNTQCRTIGVYDENDNLITEIRPWLIQESYPTWEDTRPLEANTTRTYLFKDNNLILGRQIVSCDDATINVVSNQFSGCTDTPQSSELTNTGCRTIQVFNTLGELERTIAPNETINFNTARNISIVMAGNDTLAVSVNFGKRDIDSGGCTGATSPNAIPENFKDYDMIYRVCKGESLRIISPSRLLVCPRPSPCGVRGPCEPNESTQIPEWKGGEVEVNYHSRPRYHTITFSPSQTTVYTATFPDTYCNADLAIPTSPAYKYLVIVEDTPNCQTSEQTKFEIEACIGEVIVLPVPSHDTICSGIIGGKPIGTLESQGQNFARFKVQEGGTFMSYLGRGSVPSSFITGDNILTSIYLETSCPLTTYEYTIRIKSDCENVNTDLVIFDDYPWLNTKVNSINCSSENVAVYQQGIYTYLLVSDAEGKEILYNQDGQFYCQNANDFDCVAAYNLGEPIANWNCTSTPSQDCLTEEEIIKMLRGEEKGCEIVASISKLEYEGDTYYTFDIGANPNIICPTIPPNYYEGTVDCQGQLLCESGATIDVRNPAICNVLDGEEKTEIWSIEKNDGCSYAERIRLNPCDPGTLETALYEFEGNNYVVSVPDAFSSAVPLPTIIRNCSDGSIFCSVLFTGCDDFFQRATKLEVLASRKDCSTCSSVLVTGLVREIVLIDPRADLPTNPIEVLSIQYINKATRVAEIASLCSASICSLPLSSSLSIPVAFENGNNEFEVYITFKDGLTCSYDVVVLEMEECNCTGDYTPVCGVDGKTYSNACQAECAGVEIASVGECGTTIEAICSSVKERDTDGDGTIDNRSITTYTYDVSGNETMSLTEEDDNENGVVNSSLKYIRTFDANGKETKTVEEKDRNGDGVVDGRTTTIYTYDTNGNETMSLAEFDTDGDGVVSGRTTISFTYLANGDLSTKTVEVDSNVDGEIDRRTINLYTFDASGNEIRNDYAIDTNADNIIDRSILTNTTYPNEQESILVQQLINPAEGITTLMLKVTTNFDANGNIIKTIAENDISGDGVLDSKVTRTITYDANGNKTMNLLETDHNGDGVSEFRSILTYTYDVNGNETMSLREADNNADGIVDHSDFTTSSNIYCQSDNTPNCANNTGTIFFENCDDGREYYFIRTTDGRIVDPYFDAGISFNPVNGQSVNFDFIDASFSTPCSIAEKAISITCIEEIADRNVGIPIPENFEDYDVIFRMCKGDTLEIPWLSRTFVPNCPCEQPELCGPPVPVRQIEEWNGSSFTYDRSNDKVLLHPDETDTYTVNFPSYSCPLITNPDGPVGGGGPRPSIVKSSTSLLNYLIIVEEEIDCTPSLNPEEITFDIIACPGDIIQVPHPSSGFCPFAPIIGTSLIKSFSSKGGVAEFEVISSGVVTVRNWIGDRDSGLVFDDLISFDCPSRIYNYNITCPENIETSDDAIEDAIFSQFTWLSDIVNPTACNGEAITIYQFGPYQFVYVESTSGGDLYFQDGTFYCMDSPNYNCRTAYGLSEVVDTWNCNTIPLPESKERSSTQLEVAIFTISPNPTTDRFKIELPTVSEKDYQVQVVDMLGRIVYKTELAARTTSTTIDLTAYQNGIYYVELRALGIRSIKKVVKHGLE